VFNLARKLPVWLLLIFAIGQNLAVMEPVALAKEETPANLTSTDKGDTIPVNLFKGRVSNQPGRYILGPGDSLSIKIKDLTDFNQEFTIRPDGYGTIHPFGEYYLAGVDIEGLQTWLEEKLKFYLLAPQVTIDLKELRPAMIAITGAVHHPGIYQFIREGLNNATFTNVTQEKVEITLTNVLSKAGGLSDRADIQNIEIEHVATGETTIFNLRDFLDNKDIRDIWLLPGDKIHVPELSVPMDPETFKLVSRSTFYKGKFPVVVLGSVRNQGEVQIDPTNNSLSAAIGLAGGFVSDLNRISHKGKILIQRPGNNGSYSRWVIDPKKAQFELQPGDVVYVANSKTSNIEHTFRFMTGVMLPYFYAASGTNAWKSVLNLTPIPGD